MTFIFFVGIQLLYSQAVNSKTPLTKKTTVKQPKVIPFKKIKPLAINRSKDLFAKTITRNKKVYLRWVPSNIDLWRQGINWGYIIERIPFEDYMQEGDSAKYKNAVQLNLNPVLPFPQKSKEWDLLSEKNPNAAFVYQSTYEWGKNIKPTDQDKKGKEDLLFGFSLKACDNNFESAMAAGLAFIDSVSTGTFVYRISLAKNIPGTKYSAAVTAANQNEETLLPAVEISETKFLNKKMSLTFEAKKLHDLYGGFNIERSDDAIHFRRLNTAPVTLVTTQWEKNKT
ncbi:MAG: hypothetical protein IAF38_03835, partial [Bacteroidia bacterium]|nr:hypothetical protein [Bacteroidia bacterium]